MTDTSKERRPFDSTLQGLSALYSQNFLSWLRGSEAVWLQSLDTVMTAIQRRTDFLIRYRTDQEKILHLEFQNQVRNAEDYLADLPMRMATYGILTKNRYGQFPEQVLVLISDSAAARAVPSFYQEGGMRVDFQIIRLWEVDPTVILERGLVGLLPLIPLTRGEMEPLLSQTVEAIRQRVESNEACQELLGVTALLATLRYEREQVRAFFRRRATMSLLTETPLFEVLFEEVMGDRLRKEIAQLREQARIEAEQKAEQARIEAEQLREQVRVEAEQKAEQARIEAEQKAEQARIEVEQKAEQVRVEAEQKAEQVRLEAEQRAEQARVEAEQKAEQARVEAEQKAEQARVEIQRRADRLAAQLRALGVDPDEAT